MTFNQIALLQAEYQDCLLSATDAVHHGDTDAVIRCLKRALTIAERLVFEGITVSSPAEFAEMMDELTRCMIDVTKH